jgi:excisionase family DNA binding protein
MRAAPTRSEHADHPSPTPTPNADVSTTSNGRGDRIRTCDIRLPKEEPEAAGSTSGSQVVESIESRRQRQHGSSQPFGAFPRAFAVPVLPSSSEASSIRGAASMASSSSEPLLSVRQVAVQLGLCTATVYKLCEQGRLRHVRVMNSVRVSPVDLADFIARHRTG